MIETRNVYNSTTRRSTSVIFLKDHKVVNVGKVVKVEKVGKVEDQIKDETVNEKITVPTPSTFSTLPTLPTFHEDRVISEEVDESGKSAPSISKIDRPTPTRKEDLGLQKFKAKVRAHDKHVCRLCEQRFEEPLTVRSHGGYICERCRRDGAPTEPIKSDAQVKLSEVA